MAYAYAGGGSLDYFPCHYGGSRLLFRGPARRLDLPYAVALGGTETYGRFLREPWPVLLEQQTGLRMVNLGCPNAGPDLWLGEAGLMEVIAGARLAVVQVTGAANLSNRFYAVHPRRNDRFLRASPALMALYPEVDFTNFHFTRHLLQTLRMVSPRRFETVADELRAAWVERMRALAAAVRGRAVLLWMAEAPPPPPGPARLGPEPVLVDAAMMALAAEGATAVCEAVSGPGSGAGGADGMVFAPLEAPAAAGLPGARAHAHAAARLAAVLDGLR